MHSGDYWVWVINHHGVTGNRVISDGYATPGYATGEAEMLVQWQDDVPLVQIATGR